MFHLDSTAVQCISRDEKRRYHTRQDTYSDLKMDMSAFQMFIQLLTSQRMKLSVTAISNFDEILNYVLQYFNYEQNIDRET